MIAPILAIGEKIIEKFIADPKQKSEAQLQLQKMAQDGQLKELELYLDNVASAREMHMATKDWMPSIITTVIMIGFFGCFLLIAKGWVSDQVKDIAYMMVGAIIKMASDAVNFWIGSSSGSKDKDNHIQALTSKISSPWKDPDKL